MAGAFPTSPLPATVTIESVTATQMDATQSGRTNRRQLGAQKWRIKCTFPSTMSKDQFMPIMAFLMDQEGRFETFTYIPPDLATPRGAATGTPLVNGASQTGKSIITDGWTASTLVLKAGDVIKFAGHNKVYMVTADATSDGGGNLTIAISPGMVESPGNDEALTVTDVPFTVQLTTDINGYTVSGPLLYQLALEFVEVI